MDTHTLVSEQIDDGRKLLCELVREQFDVMAAFWVKFRERPDYGPWYFYIVSRAEEKMGLQAAYRILHQAISKISSGPLITVSELRLVGPKDFLASNVLSAKQLFPKDKPIQLRPGQIGDFAVEELYIYPQASALSPTEYQTLAVIRNKAEKLKTLLDGGDTQSVREGLEQIILMSGQNQK